MARRFVLLLFGLCAIALGRDTLAQATQSDHGLTVTVSHVERNRNGYLITVDITNTSNQRLFLPQAPGRRPSSDLDPRIQSLDIEQWSDGKTNLMPKGRSLSSSLPPKAGYFSVGPCRDVPFDDHWIALKPGEHLADQIQAFEPDKDEYNPSSCTWRHVRLLGPLRITVEAFRKSHIGTRGLVTGSVDLPIPQP